MGFVGLGPGLPFACQWRMTAGLSPCGPPSMTWCRVLALSAFRTRVEQVQFSVSASKRFFAPSGSLGLFSTWRGTRGHTTISWSRGHGGRHEGPEPGGLHTANTPAQATVCLREEAGFDSQNYEEPCSRSDEIPASVSVGSALLTLLPKL